VDVRLGWRFDKGCSTGGSAGERPGSGIVEHFGVGTCRALGVASAAFEACGC
jgi:hypothetical protein